MCAGRIGSEGPGGARVSEGESKREVDLLIEGAVILPMTSEADLIWDGGIAIDAGRLIAVGPTEKRLQRRQLRREALDLELADPLHRRAGRGIRPPQQAPRRRQPDVHPL